MKLVSSRVAQTLTENAEFMDALGDDFELYREFIQALLDFGSSGGGGQN